jgi:hypothetical protein
MVSNSLSSFVPAPAKDAAAGGGGAPPAAAPPAGNSTQAMNGTTTAPPAGNTTEATNGTATGGKGKEKNKFKRSPVLLAF